jgi:hypothetical protein
LTEEVRVSVVPRVLTVWVRVVETLLKTVLPA